MSTVPYYKSVSAKPADVSGVPSYTRPSNAQTTLGTPGDDPLILTRINKSSTSLHLVPGISTWTDDSPNVRYVVCSSYTTLPLPTFRDLISVLLSLHRYRVYSCLIHGKDRQAISVKQTQISLADSPPAVEFVSQLTLGFPSRYPSTSSLFSRSHFPWGLLQFPPSQISAAPLP